MRKLFTMLFAVLMTFSLFVPSEKVNAIYDCDGWSFDPDTLVATYYICPDHRYNNGAGSIRPSTATLGDFNINWWISHTSPYRNTPYKDRMTQITADWFASGYYQGTHATRLDFTNVQNQGSSNLDIYVGQYGNTNWSGHSELFVAGTGGVMSDQYQWQDDIDGSSATKTFGTSTEAYTDWEAGIIHVNDTYIYTYDANETRFVISHEVGHFIGLEDAISWGPSFGTRTYSTIMDPTDVKFVGRRISGYTSYYCGDDRLYSQCKLYDDMYDEIDDIYYYDY